MNHRKWNIRSLPVRLALLLPGGVLPVLPVQAQVGEEEGLRYEQRSTIDTIPFRSIEEEALANTVIEGGLAAPAAGVPVQQASDDLYLDPLALQPRDTRIDLGRSEIPVSIRFSDPKAVPGQTHSHNYVIQPPGNRSYDTLNTNLISR